MSNTIYSDQIKVNCPLVHDENGYYHLIYKTTNLKNGMIYVGKHSTKDPYDNYLGSGIKIREEIKEYKPKNFIKEILYCFINENDAYLKEAEIVNFEFVNRDDTYNMVIGGNNYGGSWSGEKHPNFKKSPTKETRDKISKTLKGKLAGEKNPFYGKKHTQETREKLSKLHTGKKASKETREKMSKAHKGKPGKPQSQETREKNSKAHIGLLAGEKSPSAKVVLKLDEFGNIITEYGCVKYCREQEHISRYRLDKLLKEHIPHNGFYFVIKPKN